MRIFLVGFMGSGKSTLGKQLARLMNYDFLDQDAYIEEKTGLTVGDYFAQMGENAFREMEHQVLNEFVLKDNVVISTGGGTPCFFNNMELMNKTGVAIYLKYKPEILFSRLKHAQADRPLIRGKSPEELMSFIRSKLSEREIYYMQADHVIESLDLKAADLLRLVSYHRSV